MEPKADEIFTTLASEARSRFGKKCLMARSGPTAMTRNFSTIMSPVCSCQGFGWGETPATLMSMSRGLSP
jgi:hypothetical protein